MDKYQRPCCVLSKVKVEDESWYIGSARGCDVIGLTDFKKVCNDSNTVEQTIGHPGAFGCFIKESNIKNFIKNTNEILKDMPSEPIYRVDYIFDGINVDGDKVLDIADLDYLWGKDIQPSLIAIEGLKITNDMVTLYKKNNNITIKITLPNNVSLLIFKANDNDVENFRNIIGYIEINLIGECNKNNWDDKITPQIFIKDYEVEERNRYYF
ncbi:MAG: single-stranded-DNA-specific exonuclease [Caudoviricetes sp.]|nr:MAG: single-stranded-DNA-specific exonuclease [Caudoviricetes sp.]